MRATGTDLVSGIWRLETLKSTASIQANAHRWLELEAACDDEQVPFQSYVWCEAWARVFCRGPASLAEPSVFLVYRGDTLVAVLPMMVERHMGARVLTLFGEPHSQIANVLVRKGVDCTDGLRLCLAQASFLTRADVMALGPIPHGSPLLDALDPAGLSPDPANYLSTVRWPEGLNRDGYLKSLTKNRRKDYNRKHRILDKVGTVSITRLKAGEPGFETAAGRALAMKQIWLDREGIFSLGLSRKGTKEFLQAFSGTDGPTDIEVETLAVGGEPAAMSINLVINSLRHCYLSTYDERFARASPGTLVHHISIQDAIARGYNGYGFLGFPTPFKAAICNEEVPLVRFQSAMSVRGRIWLVVWAGGLRQITKRVLGFARGVLRTSSIGGVLRKTLLRLSRGGKPR